MYMRGGVWELLRRMPRHKPTSARCETTQLEPVLVGVILQRQTFSHDIRWFDKASQNKIDKKIPGWFLCNTSAVILLTSPPSWRRDKSGRRRDNLGFYVFVSNNKRTINNKSRLRWKEIVCFFKKCQTSSNFLQHHAEINCITCKSFVLLY